MTDPNKGEESIGYWWGNTPPYDTVNNTEYARFFIPANHDFDVSVKAWTIWGNTDENLNTFEQDFALVVVNADLINSGNAIPPKITYANTDPNNITRVEIGWDEAANMFVTGYDVYKGLNTNSFQFVHSTPYNFGAASNLNINTGYVFKVVANGPNGQQVTSNYDFAATMPFQYDIGAGVTAITAQHFNELRTGIDLIRTAAGLPTNTWAEAITAQTTRIKASHVNEMRDKLEEALSLWGATLPTYLYPDPVAGQSIIHADDIEKLRWFVH